MTARTRLLAALLVCSVVVGTVPASTAAQADGNALDVTMTVTDDGDIDTVDVSWETDPETYNALLTVATEAGYDSAAAWFAAEQLVPADNGYEAFGTAEDVEDDGVTALEIEITTFDHEGLEDTTVTADGDEVRVELADVSDPEADPQFSESTYTVVMPGEVTESNAHEVDGEVATWNLHEETPETLTAESGTEGAEDDTVPGFGVVAVVSALFVLVVAGRWDRARDAV